MDSEPGCCWRCGQPAQGACPQCQLALYCSAICLHDDRAAHLSECEEAATAELPCAYCGKQSRYLSRCARCHLAAYCSSECGDLHSRLHLPACLAGRDAVLRLANRLTHAAQPFRLPVYFGDGVHAINLLRNTDQTGEEPCQLLQLSAQLSHLLRTAAGVASSRRPLLVTLASDSGHQLARAYLLLYLLARGAGPAATVQVMYSLRLPAEQARLLRAALQQLVTATYSQLLQLVPWVRLGRAALSHWQEVWRAWLHAMQDAGYLASLERCRAAAAAAPETASRLERYLAALPETQRRSARDFLLGHGTLTGDRQRRAAADYANVTLLALSPRDQRHRDAFSDVRLGAEPPNWLEAAGGADMVLAPAPAPAGPLSDWDRAEVARALGADVDPVDGCRQLAEDCAAAAEARAADGRLSIRLVQFTSLSELDEQLSEQRFERVFTADAADRLGLFDVLEMAEVLLAPVPHALVISSHSRWAVLSEPAGTALSALRGGGSMAWDRQMDTEQFRLQAYLQGERLAYAARARHKDVLDSTLRVPTVPEVTSFGTLLMTNFSRQLQLAVPHKFRPERRLLSNGDETVRFLEWRRDPEGVRRTLAEQRDPAAAAAATVAGGTPSSSAHRGPGLYERHLQNPAPERDTTPGNDSICSPVGSERRPNYSHPVQPDQRSSLRPNRSQHDVPSENAADRRPDRAQPRRPASAPLVRTESLPTAQRRRQDSHGFQSAHKMPVYENPAAARAAARKTERKAAAGEAKHEAAREATGETRSVTLRSERLQTEPVRSQRRVSRRRTLETGPVSRPSPPPPQTEQFRRTSSLRVGKNQTPLERIRPPLVDDEELILRSKKTLASRLHATPPSSLEGMFPRLRPSLSSAGGPFANSPAAEEIYAVPRETARVTPREQIYAVPRDSLRSAVPYQQSSAGRSGTPQFALSPDGMPCAVYGGSERSRSSDTESISSQYTDSPLSASHYSALQTEKGRRRLTSMFTFPQTRPGRPSSVMSGLSTSRVVSDVPPSLPPKRSSATLLHKTEQLPITGTTLNLHKPPAQLRLQPRQAQRGYADAPQTLSRRASEKLRARQAERVFTFPRQSSEPVRPLQGEQRPRSYSEAPVPLPRKSADTLCSNWHEYDDYDVLQPRHRQLGRNALGEESPSASDETLIPSFDTDTNKNTIDGSALPKNPAEPHDEPAASPADIDRLTHWREPKSISDWLRQDRTRQSEFDRRAELVVGNQHWTRSELAPMPPETSLPTQPGRITPTPSALVLASTSTAVEKRHAFLCSRETTEERLMRSLESQETAGRTTRAASTVTAPSGERSSSSIGSPPQVFPRSRGTLTPNGDLRPNGDVLLSTEDLLHSGDEAQTIAELGLRDTAAAWVLEQCFQEVLSEERETMRAELVEWLKQKIAQEMLLAKEAIQNMTDAHRTETKGEETEIDFTPSLTSTDASVPSPKKPNAEVSALKRPTAAAKKAKNPAMKGSDAGAGKDDDEVDPFPVPKSPEATLRALQQNSSSSFDVNPEDLASLGSPFFPVVDTPAPKPIPRDRFFADMIQYQSPTTGEKFVTIRLDASSEAPGPAGGASPTKTKLFSSRVTIPSPERALAVPQRIVIDVVAEPEVMQPPPIRVPLQAAAETEVNASKRSSTPPFATVAGTGGKRATNNQDDSVPAPAAPEATALATDKPSTSDSLPSSQQTDMITPAPPAPLLTLPASTAARREAVKPLSLNSADNNGPSGHLYRSPVEDPYPVPGNELSNRRARLEARAARQASASTTDQSSASDSSPDQPQSPLSTSGLERCGPTGEAHQTATRGAQDDVGDLRTAQDAGNGSDSRMTEILECDESKSVSRDRGEDPESVNILVKHRSSLYIPMEQIQRATEDPELREILVKFPLVTMDSGESQAGQPDITVLSPSRNTAAASTEPRVKEAPAGRNDATAELDEEHAGLTLDTRGNDAAPQSEAETEQRQVMRTGAAEASDAGKTCPMDAAPTPATPVEEADISEDDSTLPPLPLSPPPPKSAVHPLLVTNGDVVTVKDAAMVAESTAEMAECNETATEGGAIAAETHAAVANNTTEMAKKGADATDGDTEATQVGGTAFLRRSLVGQKQRERLGNLVRRRSRKMSMDKEYHYMKSKLTETNAAHVPHNDTESEESHGQNMSAKEAHSTAGSPNRSNGARHPGSLALSRRKSRPLSMDAEYYAMKSQLQVHNGHPGGHSSGHGAAGDAQVESAELQTGSHIQSQALAANRTIPAPATAPASTSQSPASAPRRRASGRLSMDKEFLAMRAELALYTDGHSGSVPGRPSLPSTGPGYEAEKPFSPPPSPVSGWPPAALQPCRASRRLSIEQEFFASRAAHLARQPVQSDSEEQSRSSAIVEQGAVPRERPEVAAPPDRPAVGFSAISPQTSKPPENRQQTASTSARSEQAAARPAPQFPPSSPATPPSSPALVLSRTGRQGSIRRQLQELERSGAEESPEQQGLAAALFSRTGSVRDKVRRMELFQQGQTVQTVAVSPVTPRKCFTHSPFSQLGSGSGGGVTSRLTVRLQPSPPGAAQSPSDPQPLIPAAWSGAEQSHRLYSGFPSNPETLARATSDESGRSPGPHSENASVPGDLSNKSETLQPSHTTPRKPVARRAQNSTPSPPNLLAWPWTAEDEGAAQTAQAQQAGKPCWPEPSAARCSAQQHNESPSCSPFSPDAAHQTANQSSLSPKPSVTEGRQSAASSAQRKEVPQTSSAPLRAGLEASSDTEIDTQDDDVFTDASGTPAAVTTTVTSL